MFVLVEQDQLDVIVDSSQTRVGVIYQQIIQILEELWVSQEVQFAVILYKIQVATDDLTMCS